MDKRFFVFLALSMFVLVGSQAIFDRLYPPPEPFTKNGKEENTDSETADSLQQTAQLRQQEQVDERESGDPSSRQEVRKSTRAVTSAIVGDTRSSEGPPQRKIEQTELKNSTRKKANVKKNERNWKSKN